MNCNRSSVGWHVGFFPKSIDPLGNPFGGIARKGIVVRQHFARAHQQGLRRDQVCVLYSYCHRMAHGPWDPRDPVAVELSLCPSVFQDRAEPEPLDTDVAFVSNVVTRAAICSIFVIVASYEATVWESVWTQFSNLDMLCMSSGNLEICTNIR